MKSRASIGVLALALAACGGTPAGTGAPGGQTANPGATTGAATTTGPASGSSCPLTVEQVAAVLGATVQAAGACTFFPPDDAPGVTPNALFNYQVASACDASQRAELGYSEAIDGLGNEAWVQRDMATGTSILVCGDRPFEVTVDIVPDLSSLPEEGFEAALVAAQEAAAAARFEAANALAKLVLASL